MVFFWLIPILSIPTCFKYNVLFRIGLSSILILWGIVWVNYLQSFYFGRISEISLLPKMYILLMPTIFIYIGYMALMKSPLKSANSFEAENKEDRIRMINFDVFLGAVYFMSMMSVPFVLTKLSFTYGYEIPFLSVVIASIYLCLEIKNISPYSLNHYSKDLTRIPHNPGKIFKYWKVILILIMLKSFLDEYQYRGNWLLWGESITAFLILNFLLFKFRTLLFQPTSAIPKTDIYLPSGKNMRTIIITVSVCIVSVIMALYIDSN